MNTRRNSTSGGFLRLALLGILLLGGMSIIAWIGSPPSEAAIQSPGRAVVDTPNLTDATSTGGCTSGVWSVIASPSVQTGANSLSRVAAVSPDDVWAVGGYFMDALGVTRTLTLHWDGSEWTQVASPNIGSDTNALHGITVVAANNIWAVGEYLTGRTSAAQTLILHWDGNSWTHSASPNVPNSDNYLFGVTAISANDIWAVGSSLRSEVYRSLTMHYDGSQWTIVPSPNPSVGNNSLAAVAAAASNNVYAVGGSQDTVALRWNGSAWSHISTPNPGTIFSALYDVAVAPGGNVWAVGYYSNSDSFHTLILRNWEQVTSPSPSNYSKLYSISAVGANDVWAVGYYTPGMLSQTLTTHWDGTEWGIVLSPFQPWQTNLYGVEAVSSGEVWIVGSVRNPEQTLTMHYSGPPSANFSDISPTDWFFDSVQCLYCHGAISGYADNTFQPYNNTTRAQMCKIVVLAFSIPINTNGGPHYTDVADTDPFYGFIETASNNGLVSGYSDHTFQPGDEVTRGQLSKIVVSAAMRTYGWTLRNPQTPSFTDVSTSDTFYRYVETAACYQIIGGYADHTFQPGDSATRAQISKIVCLATRNGPPCE